jgi:PhoPQ-activated pathogenicity-related protein
MSNLRERRSRNESLRVRRLRVESLEQRRVLSAAAPWHNDAAPLDVNNDGWLYPLDALIVINRLLQLGVGPLEEPSATPENYYDTSGDNMLTPLDLVRVFNGILKPPDVRLDTLMPFTIDVTPRLEVSIANGVSVPDGTPVHVDVDLNNDGQFIGAELDYTVSSMYRGRSEFALAPALPANEGTETYSVNLRARVDGQLKPSVVQPMVVDTQTSDALANYVNTPDDSYEWNVEYDVAGPGGAYHFYVLSMTSQTWHEGDVNDPVWDHWLRVVVPNNQPVSETALLLIGGGHNDSNLEKESAFNPIERPEDAALLNTALATGTIAVELRVVPNEAVYFFEEQPIRIRSEDDIIAYTFDQYLSHIGEPGNETWPLLLPMVKSAVRAMDAIQEFSTEYSPTQVENFIVTGYSKRGWTTWLTTATDDRIIASIPGVFDNPNQGPSMVHHYEVLGQFSEQVDPYSEMQIFERLRTPEAALLSRITDPYRYFENGRMDKPKLILNSAGDEFFMPDSSQFYFADIPGEDNYMRYFPNTGHGLDVGAIYSTVAFTDAIINNRHLPDFSWTVEPNSEIHVSTIDTPIQVRMWQATNPVSRDFRHKYNLGIIWTSSVLADQGGGNYVGSVPYPDTGSTAFFVELTFESGVQGVPHVFTTDVRVNSDLPRTPFPYSSDPISLTVTNSATTVPVADAHSANVVPLFALPADVATREVEAPPAPDALISAAPSAALRFADALLTAAWQAADTGERTAGPTIDDESLEHLLDELLSDLASYS